MTRLRIPALAFGALTVCLVAMAAHGQTGTVDLKSFRMEGKPLDGTGLNQLQQMNRGEARTRGPKETANKALLKQAAELYVFRVTQDQFYTGGDTGELKVRTGGDQNLDVAFDDLNIHLLVPKPGQRILIDQMNYIEDFGAALDQAVVTVLTGKGGVPPPPVIRINATRMLAMAARTGAPAHAKTITALLANQLFKANGKPTETPPDVLLWALKAAENLLAAPDPSALGTPNAARHTLKDQDLVPLVQALNDIVLKNPKGLAEKAATLNPVLAVKPPPTPGAPPANADPKAPAPASTLQTEPNALTVEQVELLRYFRRQAIRALGELRFDTLAEGTPNQVRPAFTLAQVAVSDVSLNPPPNVSEVGEAVIGLCNIHPSTNLNVDALLHVIAYGTGRFFALKAEKLDDKTLPWKAYAARVDDAFALLQKNAQINPRLTPFRKQIGELAGIVTSDVTAPLTAANGTGRPGFERLSPWVQSNAPKGGLFSDNKQLLKPRP